MTVLEWDKTGERYYETGVDHGVLYVRADDGSYNEGVVWNGLTAVNESPSGAEPNPQYADNIKYLNLVSAEEFGGTIEAFTYPDEFGVCDGTASPAPGVSVGQQPRRTFGFSYRTKVGNDVAGQDLGYKLHVVWGALAAPSEKNYSTVNDSPEAVTFSWEFSTTKTNVGVVDGKEYGPTSVFAVDSTRVSPAALAALEDLLYGTGSEEASLPEPAEVLQLFLPVEVNSPTAPTENANIITIPTVTGVNYQVGGVTVTGTYEVTAVNSPVTVNAVAMPGYTLTGTTSWAFTYEA